MGEEPEDLVQHLARRGCGLAARRRDADDDVSEESSGVVGELPLPLREREDVRGFVLLSILAIEILYFVVTGEHDGQLERPELEGVEHRPGRAQDR
jgi:hypothetical protein